MLGMSGVEPCPSQVEEQAVSAHTRGRPRAPLALTSCLRAIELKLTSLQPAWQGERYSTPLSPQTGWKAESGHEQSRRQ